MSDYKYEMQLRAEELAEERFGLDFYDLPPGLQDETFNDAMQDWHDRQVSKAENLQDR